MRSMRQGVCYLSVLLSVFCWSCSKVPSGILGEKEMQRVMTDVYLAEAMIGIDQNTYRSDSMKQALYESVFRKHGITQAVYDSSIMWYGRNMDVYMGIYERMVKDLDVRVNALGDIEASAVSSSNDSVDIWPRRSRLVLSPGMLFNGTTFDISPEESYPSGSTFVLGLRVWGLAKDMKHCPEIRISADQGDTTVTVTDRIQQDGYHETVLRSVAVRKVKRVYGYIRLDNGGMDYYKVFLDNLTLMRYNYGSEKMKENKKSDQPEADDEE